MEQRSENRAATGRERYHERRTGVSQGTDSLTVAASMRRPVPVKPKMILGRKTTTAHRRPTGGATPGRITTNGDPRPTGGPPSASFFPLRSGLVLLFWSCRHTGDRDHREPRSFQHRLPAALLPLRRRAPLPFALFNGRSSLPVPVGVLNLKTGAAISVPN
jgi:hypothetical protein